MNKYRIVPSGTKWWNVQRRLFGVLWWTRANYISLDSEKEAEDWINYMLKQEAEYAEGEAQAVKRYLRYPPRRYP